MTRLTRISRKMLGEFEKICRDSRIYGDIFSICRGKGIVLKENATSFSEILKHLAVEIENIEDPNAVLGGGDYFGLPYVWLTGLFFHHLREDGTYRLSKKFPAIKVHVMTDPSDNFTEAKIMIGSLNERWPEGMPLYMLFEYFERGMTYRQLLDESRLSAEEITQGLRYIAGILDRIR